MSEASGSSVLMDESYGSIPGVEARLVSPFEGVPLHGFAPVHIRLKNPTGRSLSWRIRSMAESPSSGSGGLKGSMSVVVDCPAGSEVARDLLIPLPPTVKDTWNRQVKFRMQLLGSGKNEKRSFQNGSQATPKWPGIGIGSALAKRNLSELKKVAEKRNSKARNFGVVIHEEHFPADWRAFSGFDVLILTGHEWQKLEAKQRAAVHDWIRLGGTLDLYVKAGGGSLSELGFGKESEHEEPNQRLIGLGRVRSYSLQGEIINAKVVCERVTKMGVRNRGAEMAGDFRRPTWLVAEDLGTRPFHSVIWLGLLVLFGILVGPINLFLLAGKQRRHRLLITTPLIALATSVLLAVLILVIDGVGGRGHRFLVIELNPGVGGRSAFVSQQSLASTGLLTRSGFVEKHPAVHFPVVLPKSRWSRIVGTSSDQGKLNVSAEGEFYGDWLLSRSRHGFISQKVVPSRARFELAGTVERPFLVSGLGFSTENVFYIAQDGAIWRSETGTEAGSRIELVLSDRRTFDAWREEAIDRASDGLRRDLREQPLRRGFFYTSVVGETGMELDFGDMIRWEKTRAFLYGPVLAAGAGEKKGEDNEGISEQ